jgi:hypothetical protein
VRVHAARACTPLVAQPTFANLVAGRGCRERHVGHGPGERLDVTATEHGVSRDHHGRRTAQLVGPERAVYGEHRLHARFA